MATQQLGATKAKRILCARVSEQSPHPLHGPCKGEGSFGSFHSKDWRGVWWELVSSLEEIFWEGDLHLVQIKGGHQYSRISWIMWCAIIFDSASCAERVEAVFAVSKGTIVQQILFGTSILGNWEGRYTDP